MKIQNGYLRHDPEIATRDVDKAGTGARKEAVGSPASEIASSVKVTISERAGQLTARSAESSARLERLRASIKEGTLVPDSKAIAAQLLSRRTS
jgi:anti-sigma28 factor (negative regulator of flagellin synthesis)